MVSIAAPSIRSLRSVLARTGAEEGRGRDEAEPPAVLQQPDAPLVEIGVEVGAVGGDDIMLGEIRLDRLDKLHPHIGRIADHDIEAAARENFGERRAPIERARAYRRRPRQAVADADRRFQVLQPMLAPRRLQPERQPRDLDRFRVEVDADKGSWSRSRRRRRNRWSSPSAASARRRARIRSQPSKAATRKAPEPQAGSTIVKRAQRCRDNRARTRFATPRAASPKSCRARRASNASVSVTPMVFSTRKRVTISGV